jgi:hypothetical protein
VAFPVIPCTPDVVRQAQSFALLHDMGGFVRSQMERWSIAKSDTISRSVGEGAYPAVRGARPSSYARAYPRHVMMTERSLNPFTMGEGLAGAFQSCPCFTLDLVGAASLRSRLLHLLLILRPRRGRTAARSPCLQLLPGGSLLGLHTGGLIIFPAIPKL